MSEAITQQESGDRKRTSSEESELEFDVLYPPIVNLPEVTVPTNEEDEVLMLKMRAKFYRFDTTSDDMPEWKERGTGEVKVLKNNEHKTVRIVMRRDKTLKVCANHFITPFMELKPSANSEKAFIYRVADFADEQIKLECCAIRFGNVEFAKQFKQTFDEAKTFVLKECSLYNGVDTSLEDNASEADESTDKDETEIVEKLSELDVSKTDTK